ncbi:class I glutamine amidotransferase family protein [Myxococcus stipitatus DSM 14675]|uniref:Class I glutamine amidotransferase family protein n=1 Tax=Myxococcus stipitatus (strain DSM 14675 / JCM 12634 / Mx s8) TaxID=1278073 RepID=L7UBW6_MYXSD|nr:glutamine amidotransferase [Myxococcus stipitatus]AGC45385.1 class I glutamine amidotransferase family protein [Myxococcus stipitatus DSM 14675]
MRAVVYQHEEHEGVGLLGPALTEVGFTLVHRFRAARREDVDAELLVVMGGPMGVYEADQHPFLREELAILTERLAYERACLGICLGAQMLASAAGAEVFAGKNGFEVGVAPVRWTADGVKDEVIAGARPRTVVAHWHGDTYKPVPGATLLASTDRYSQQAFRLGTSYGFQFHLELTAREMGRWLDLGAEDLRQRGKDLDELKAQLPKLESAERENVELLQRLARHFAQAVR